MLLESWAMAMALMTDDKARKRCMCWYNILCASYEEEAHDDCDRQ